MASFLGIHITSGATAYMEVRALFNSKREGKVLIVLALQGTWVWLADHDLDGDGSSQITLFSGRGILSESAGPVWLVGTGECTQTYNFAFDLMLFSRM